MVSDALLVVVSGALPVMLSVAVVALVVVIRGAPLMLRGASRPAVGRQAHLRPPT